MKRFIALLIVAVILLGICPTGVSAAPLDRQDFSTFNIGDDLISSGAFSEWTGVSAEAVADPTDLSNICAYLGLIDSHVHFVNIKPSAPIPGKVTVEYRVMVNDYSYRHLPSIHASSGSEMLVGEVVDEKIYVNGLSGGRARLEKDRWIHYRYDLDTDKGSYALYIDGSDQPALLGTMGNYGPVRDITFLMWDMNSHMYVDDIAIYQTPQNAQPGETYSEEFDYSAGTQLSDLTNLSVDGTPEKAQVVRSNDLNMAQLSVKGDNKGSMSLDLSDKNFKGSFTVEMRAKLATMGNAQLKIEGVDEGKDATLAQLLFDNPANKDLSIVDELNNRAWVGKYIADCSPDKPDFGSGWKTLRVNVNPSTDVVTVSIDGQARKYTKSLQLSDNIQLTTVTVTASKGAADRGDLYIDWIRVVPGQSIIPGPLASESVFTQDFEGTQSGDALNNNIFIADGGVTVTAAEDPLGSGSMCAELKDIGLTAGGSAHANIPLGAVYEGRVDLSFRILIKDTCYRHAFCVYSNSGDEILVGQTYDGGDYGSRFNDNKGTDNSADPLFEANVWHTLRYELDTEAGTFKRYLDDSIQPVRGAIGESTDIMTLSFGLWQDDTRDTRFYLDDIKVAKAEGCYSEAEKAAQLESGRRMMELINGAILDGKSSCVIPYGAYRLKEDCRFLIDHVSDFTLDGSGSELWISDHITGLVLNECTNVTVRGFRADYDPLPFSQGTIVALYPESQSFDLQIDEGYRVPDESWNGNMRAIFFNADGSQEVPATYNDSAWWGHIVDAEKRIINLGLYAGDIFKYDLGVKPGDKFVCLANGEGIGINIEKGNSNTIEDFDLYSAWRFAVADSGGEGGNIYRNFRIIRRPGTDRLMAGNSDGLHSARAKNGPKLYNCEISHTGDDLVNIQGFLDYVYNQVSDNVIDVTATFGLDFEQGSELNFYDIRSWDPLETAKVVSYEQITDTAVVADAAALPTHIRNEYGLSMRDISPEVWRVTLDRPVNVKKYDVVESKLLTGKGAVFSESSFHDGHVRGILLRSPGGVVENCTFKNIGGPAVYIAPERYWAEGPFTNDITIKGNTMIQTAIGIGGRYETPGAITVFATPTDDCHSFKNNYNLKNITIEDNTIIDSGSSGVFVANVDGVSISGNHIEDIYSMGQSEDDGKRWELPKPWYGIYVANGDNVNVDGNTFANMPDFAVGNIHNPTSGIVWEPMETLDGSGLNWQVKDMNLAVSSMLEQGSDDGGNCLVATSTSDSASLKHDFAVPLNGKFAVSFASKLGTGNVHLPVLYDSNGNSAFDLYFNQTDGLLYSGNIQLGQSLANEWHTYTAYFDTTANTWEIWREATKLGTGTFTADAVSAIEFSAARTGTLLLDNVSVYDMNEGITASAEWTDTGVTVTVNNQLGQSATVYAAEYDGNCLKAIEKQDITAGFSGKLQFNMPNANKIFVWRDMKPILPTIVKEEGSVYFDVDFEDAVYDTDDHSIVTTNKATGNKVSLYTYPNRDTLPYNIYTDATTYIAPKRKSNVAYDFRPESNVTGSSVYADFKVKRVDYSSDDPVSIIFTDSDGNRIFELNYKSGKIPTLIASQTYGTETNNPDETVITDPVDGEWHCIRAIINFDTKTFSLYQGSSFNNMTDFVKDVNSFSFASDSAANLGRITNYGMGERKGALGFDDIKIYIVN